MKPVTFNGQPVIYDSEREPTYMTWVPSRGCFMLLTLETIMEIQGDHWLRLARARQGSE